MSAAAPRLERVLRERGATHAETVAVLVRPIDDLPPEDAGTEVVTVLVDDEPTVRAATGVRTRGWGQPAPDAAQFTADLAWVLRDPMAGPEFRVVARIGTDWVATGGCEVADGVARLWGAVTLPKWRGRGAYRSVLRERMRIAGRRGADLALVKGRVDTSAPILRRLGFEEFGEERRYELTV